MRIKKLELTGFKSFKDRTVLQFDKGITGIVGPNGCGKSNIVDALVWVMGEMSAKHLRGSSMSDVIFAGAESYAPMGMAEVSMVLENEGGPFPVKYLNHSEIMITRRLHRSGESEYLINKEEARLRDIQEIFMDTGAGARGFSIIEQGRIGEIITKKPIDRRSLIEEVAGITKFKVRKRESQRKLMSTEQNLVRLQDIIGEQKRQLGSLERQAKRADRYRQIKNELQEKELWLSGKKYEQYKTSIQEQQIEFDNSREKEVSIDALVQQLGAEVEAMRLKSSEAQAKVEAAQGEYQEKQRLTIERENLIRECRFEVEQARRNKEMAASVADQQQARKKDLDSEKKEISDKLNKAQQRASEIETQLRDVEQKNSSFVKSANEAEQTLSAKKEEWQSVCEESVRVEAQLKSLEIQKEEKEKELGVAKKTLKELHQVHEKNLREHKGIAGSLEEEKQLQLGLMTDVENFEENLKKLTEQKNQKEEEHALLKDRLNRVSSRLDGLEDLQCSYEGFEEGVKSIMLWQKQKPGSHFKPLAEVVEVAPKYEVAVEAALGEGLQILLNQSHTQAIEALDYLKDNKSGRSSFLSESLPFQQDHSQICAEEGIKALLWDVVSVPSEYEGQLASLLNSVVVVESLQRALQLKDKYPKYFFVTLEGDSLSSEGILSGGSGEHIESGVLKRRREIKELSVEKEEILRELAVAERSLKKLIAQFNEMSECAEDARQSRSKKEIQVVELKKDFERIESEMLASRQALDSQTEKLQLIEETLFSIVGQLAELNGLADTNLRLKTQLKSDIIEWEKKVEANRLQGEVLRTTLTDLQVEDASRRQEVSGFNYQLDMISRSLKGVEEHLSEISQNNLSNSEVMTEGQTQLSQLQSELDLLIQETQRTSLSVGEARDSYEKLQSLLSESQEKMNELYAQKNELQTNFNGVQLRLEQLKMQEQNLVDQVRERYMRELSELGLEFQNQDWNTETTEKEVEELRSKISQIGEVNLSAIEEYDELVQRYEFLQGQHEDLLMAKDQLRRVIERINRICSSKFKETFEQVNERFKKVFPALFGGGQAELILVEDPEKDEVGIDIMAMPFGKKMQNVNLLSGGEKALTAVSLVFAIFLVKPSPFCLLDEVDAPLDDANVFRFNELVREMAKRSQMIVVTHNKHTMKVNNKLFGVTMQEKGISKMVSVSLDDERSTFQPEMSI